MCVCVFVWRGRCVYTMHQCSNQRVHRPRQHRGKRTTQQEDIGPSSLTIGNKLICNRQTRLFLSFLMLLVLFLLLIVITNLFLFLSLYSQSAPLKKKKGEIKFLYFLNSDREVSFVLHV